MKANIVLLIGCTLIASGASAALNEEVVDYEIVARIKAEGLERSQVMDHLWRMTDLYGPRLSNAPSYNQAADWARGSFAEWGADRAEVEPYGEIGLGWDVEYVSAHMTAPQYWPLIAYPVRPSRGTDGKVVSNAVLVNTDGLFTEADLDRFRGQLRGKIVLTESKRFLEIEFNPVGQRISEEELDSMAERVIDPPAPTVSITRAEYEALLAGDVPPTPLSEERVRQFFEDEGMAVLVAPGPPGRGADTGAFDKGIVRLPGGYAVPSGGHKPLPELVMSAEHYNRLIRLIEHGVEVEMEVETRVRYDDDLQDYNVIAEIAGSDLSDEVVLIGGHYDGKFGGTGATDNATGSAMVMEAFRILKALGIQPRRTIRAALWGGHEGGHAGAGYYVRQHYGDPETQEYLPQHERLSVYFNVDWYGRFRGIYLNGNDLVRPIFDEWMKPFHDLGMTHLVSDNSGGSDHMAFINVGLPGFQFIQDDLEYFNTNHHTNMDVYDRAVAEDLMQGSVIAASWVYNAAMRDAMLPRTESQRINNRRWHR